MAADDVPVIDFPVEEAGDGPSSGDVVTEVANPVETAAEPAMPELVEPAPVESHPAESPAPELVEALPAPLERPAAAVEAPREHPRPVANTASNARSLAVANPVARTSSPGVGGGTGTASAPVLFGSAGTGRFPLPPYPSEARRRGIEGNVMLRVEVSERGQPNLPRIESSSGSSSLDRAAVDWIRARWRWEPGPVRHYRIPICYQIR
jgi:protein TonB